MRHSDDNRRDPPYGSALPERRHTDILEEKKYATINNKWIFFYQLNRLWGSFGQQSIDEFFFCTGIF
jgi:hypothetical protein